MQSHFHCILLGFVFVSGTGECGIASNTPLFWFCYIDGQQQKTRAAAQIYPSLLSGLYYWMVAVLYYYGYVLWNIVLSVLDDYVLKLGWCSMW